MTIISIESNKDWFVGFSWVMVFADVWEKRHMMEIMRESDEDHWRSTWENADERRIFWDYMWKMKDPNC